MNTALLGQSNIQVSSLCYGTEPFTFKKGPEGAKTQGDVTPSEGGEILSKAYKLGVNFWDTSDDYGTHPHVAEGLKRVPRGDVVVADKTNAYTREGGRAAIERSLRGLGTDYVDIMFLHIVPPSEVGRRDALGRPYISKPLEGRMETLEALLDAKEMGELRAIGLSTHSTEVLRRVLDVPEIDVVCTPLNKSATYIDDGITSDRIEALRKLHEAGKGVYLIKILDAGRLRDQAESAIRYTLGFKDFVDAWNIGMYNVKDVKTNLKLFKYLLE